MKRILMLLLAITLQQTMFAQTGQLEKEAKTYKSASGEKIEGFAGRLMVPENRDNPQSTMIPIHFVHLKSTNPTPKAPIIYLEGGPGSSCTWQADNEYYMDYWLKFLAVSDVILLDQRGTGKGGDRVTYIWTGEVADDVFVSYENAKTHFQKVARAALPAFQEKGVDLNGYTTKANAQDMDALRKALGIDKYNLFGFSYGTHLGQAYLRYFGDRVENAVLVGVEGPNHTYKLPSTMDIQFNKLVQMAKQDPEISKLVPDMEVLFKKLLKKLEKEPIALEVRSPLTRQAMPLKIGPFGLRMLLRFDIGDASDIPVFPRLLYAIDQGDYGPLKWFLQKRVRVLFGAQGMASTMDMASGITESRRLRVAQEEKESLFPGIVNVTMDLYDDMDGFWPDPDLGEEFRSPLITDVRTLFMSGTLDFNTPPYQAEEVRWGYSNSSHIIVTNAGHEQILTHDAAVPNIIKFLQGEDVSSVALSHPPLKFIPLQGKDSEVWHPSLGKQ